MARTGFEPARAEHTGFQDQHLGPGLVTLPVVKPMIVPISDD